MLMGCICTKEIPPQEQAKIHREIETHKSSRPFVASSRRDDIVISHVGGGGGTARQIPKVLEISVAPPPPIPAVVEKKKVPTAHFVVDVPQSWKGNGHQRRATVDVGVNEPPELNLRIPHIPDGFEAEHVAAGWPPWLTSVAEEAVKGWLPRKASSFEKLYKIGQGTYSSVYKARDLETGKTVALKKVRFVNMDPESVRFMAREIHILRKLDHPNIVKLEGLIASRTSGSMYLVLEYMEHDLAGLAATPGIKFTEPQVKCYMQQLLHGLRHCHSRGILHRDIKGSNLLVDNNGVLKITDFGLATFFGPYNSQPLTSRVVTLWYRPPELLLGATEYDVAVDLWSSGCILGELLAGKPILPGRTEVEQLHKIFKLCGSPPEEYWRKSKLPHATIFKPQRPYRRCVLETFKDFPTSALSLLDVLLSIDPERRGTTSSALNSEFFTTKPYACEPSTLPKYPPSKEYDVKLRDEEDGRRQRAAPTKGHEPESVRRGSRDFTAMRAPDAHAEFGASMRAQSNRKGITEKYNLQENNGSWFPLDPPKRTTVQNGFSHSVSSRESSNGVELKTQKLYMPQGGGVRTSGKSENLKVRSNNNLHWPQHSPQLDVAEASEKQDWWPSSSHKKDVRIGAKEPSSGYGTKKNRIHYSGPLMPPGGNMEDMLKEHERQIQQAVRKARIDKAKPQKDYSENGQFEAMLFRGGDGSFYV